MLRFFETSQENNLHSILLSDVLIMFQQVERSTPTLQRMFSPSLKLTFYVSSLSVADKALYNCYFCRAYIHCFTTASAYWICTVHKRTNCTARWFSVAYRWCLPTETLTWSSVRFAICKCDFYTKEPLQLSTIFNSRPSPSAHQVRSRRQFGIISPRRFAVDCYLYPLLKGISRWEFI